LEGEVGMKKTIIVLSVIALVLTIFGGLSLANNTWDFKKLVGVFKSQDGVLYSVPSLQEKDKVTNSIEPKSGKATYGVKSTAFGFEGTNLLDLQEQEKTINFNFENKNVPLNFRFISRNNKTIVLPNPNEGYVIKPIPNNSKYVLQYNSSLYLLDVENSNITALLKDQIGGFDKQVLSEKKVDDLVLSWGESANVNFKGNKIVFYTNRKMVQEEKGTGEIWVKDLNTNEEKPIFNGGVSNFLGWDAQDNVYIQQGYKIVKVNTILGDSKVITENASLESKMMYPYILIPLTGKVELYNLETNETKVYEDTNLNRINYISVQPESRLAALQNYPLDGSGESEILVLNVDTLQTKKIQAPPDTFLEEFDWANPYNLLVTILKKGTKNQDTYLIEMNGL
jgi:hypothetical protein